MGEKGKDRKGSLEKEWVRMARGSGETERGRDEKWSRVGGRGNDGNISR